MAHTSSMQDKQGYTHARRRALAQTHTQIFNIHCFTPATIIRERASLLRLRTLSVLLHSALKQEFRKK